MTLPVFFGVLWIVIGSTEYIFFAANTDGLDIVSSRICITDLLRALVSWLSCLRPVNRLSSWRNCFNSSSWTFLVVVNSLRKSTVIFLNSSACRLFSVFSYAIACSFLDCVSYIYLSFIYYWTFNCLISFYIDSNINLNSLSWLSSFFLRSKAII